VTPHGHRFGFVPPIASGSCRTPRDIYISMCIYKHTHIYIYIQIRVYI